MWVRNQGDAMRSDPSAWALFSLPPVRDPEPHGRLGIEKRIGPRRSPNALLIHETITSKAEKKKTRCRTAQARGKAGTRPPPPPPSRNARLPECACATRGGKRWGVGDLVHWESEPPPTPPAQANAARARTTLTVPRARATAAAGRHARALEGGVMGEGLRSRCLFAELP